MSVNNKPISERLASKTKWKVFDAIYDVLKDVPEFDDWIRRMDKCRPMYRCNLPICYDCNVQSNGLQRHKTTFTGLGAKARNHKKSSRQRYQKYFHCFPEERVWPLTINYRPVTLEPEAVKEALSDFRESLKYLCKTKFDLMVCMGKFEIALKEAGRTSKHNYDRANYLSLFSDDEVVAHLHFHGLVWDVEMNKSEISEIFQKKFRGSCQVYIDEVSHKPDHNNNDQEGIGGWGEYSAKRIPEFKFADQNEDIVVKYFRVLKKIHGNSFNFKYGLSPKGNHLYLSNWDWVRDNNGQLISIDLDTGMTEQDVLEDMHQDYMNGQNRDSNMMQHF